MNIPQINKTYNYFDDGKISFSRLEEVEIKKLIPFNKASKKLLKEWQKEVKQCDWLYRAHTDYFVKGCLKDSKENIVFVRCKRINGWFSLGWNAGRLDIDGSLIKNLCDGK